MKMFGAAGAGQDGDILPFMQGKHGDWLCTAKQNMQSEFQK